MPAEASLANLQPAWQPGQSGNTRGMQRGYRRVLSESRKLSLEALSTITTCMRDTEAPWASRLRACEVILDRAWGEAEKTIALDANGIVQLRVEFHGVEHHANGKGNGQIIDVPLEPLE